MTMTTPDSRGITYTYGSSGGLHDDETSRVTTVVDSGSSVTLARYSYLGAGTVVRQYLDEISCMSRVYDDSTPSAYSDLDRFNRITTSRWTKDLSTDRDFYSVGLTYDRDSNITSAQDNVHGAYHTFGSGYDVAYSMDNVNRLTEAKEGTLSSGTITSPTRDEQWTLSHTGNWDREKLDLNGDGDFVDANELDDTRTHNAVNELTARDTDSNGSSNYTLSYDAAGNLTDDGKDYKYVYDVWNRLRLVEKTSNSALVAEYRYNGLNHRIAVHEDTDLDGDVDGSDKWYFDVFDERWRELARYRESDSSPKEDFVPHQAGAGGCGQSSYIDLVICRNRDANTAWTSASDGTLEERVYHCQNWRADVSAVVSSAGTLLEWAKYSAYGTPIGLPGGDSDSDGDIDATDRSNVQAWISGPTYDVRGDLNLDGVVDATDKGMLVAKTLGRGVLSASGVVSRRGYAGYEALSGLVGGKWLARNRVLAADLGRWISRDPIGYIDGAGLCEYAQASPVIASDALGLFVGHCGPAYLSSESETTFAMAGIPTQSLTIIPLGFKNTDIGCGGCEAKLFYGSSPGPDNKATFALWHHTVPNGPPTTWPHWSGNGFDGNPPNGNSEPRNLTLSINLSCDECKDYTVTVTGPPILFTGGIFGGGAGTGIPSGGGTVIPEVSHTWKYCCGNCYGHGPWPSPPHDLSPPPFPL